MSRDEKHVYAYLYRQARRPEDLPWYQSAVWPMLERVATRRVRPARALDVGCGTGGFAIYLVRLGYQVTALDFLTEPLRMAVRLAQAAGAEVQFVQADARCWNATVQFDLILDSGCLHGLDDGGRRRYHEQLMGWLAPDGDFVLIHFGRMHALDWRPVGPRRIPRSLVEAEFAPDLLLHDYAEEIRSGLRFPAGPRGLIGQYHFRRAGS
ncbi:MAG: hypothetical protein OHK0022_02530 [Roseiflexaceae bacterium]